jgi:esterase/lipase
MRAALPLVKTPVLVVHSQDDSYVLPVNLEKIHDALVHASDRTKLYITESGHIVTRDASRERVFEAVLEFIRKVEKRFES